MILTVVEDFDGFRQIYSVVDIDSEPPQVVKAFTTQKEAEEYIQNNKIADIIL